MFALIFDFPTGRYHATPWGRHVNEADVAWPPEPWRILRTLIACYWRKGNRVRWPESRLSGLIDALASALPVYSLPEGAVHAHTRHYMPAPAKKTLIFDAFAHVPKGEKLTVAWPDLELDTETFDLAADLASSIGYLGRAESWTECRATAQWDSQQANCLPVEESDTPAIENVVRIVAARSARDYATERERLMREFEDGARAESEASGKRPPTSSSLERRRKKVFGPTLPERLTDALALDTADYQKYGWSRPPAAREVLYERPSLSAVPRVLRRAREVPDDRSHFTVARFLLAGRPPPRVEDSVKIGELMRLAALSRFGWENGRPKAPSVISGRGPDNKPLRDGEHTHAFWLPEDADEDGRIDHISVYAPSGFSADVRERFDRLTRLWVRGKESGDGETGRQEWRLALEGFGCSKDFEDTSRLFRRKCIWTSATPFLATGHLKKSGYAGEIRRLLKRRKIVPDTFADDVKVEVLPCIMVNGAPRRAVHFHRFRKRRGEEQPDAQGVLLRLSFPEPIVGPLSLGYASHFGLGLFK